MPEDSALSEPILMKTAEDAAVLLRNGGNALPLTANDLANVALIGPGAGQTIAIGLTGGKGPGIPSHQTGTVAEIEKLSGRKITFAVANDMTGRPIPASALSHGGIPGLLRAATTQQTDAQLNFTVSNGNPLPPGSSGNWSGALAIPNDGAYMIALQALGTAANVSLDGQMVLRTGTPGPGRAGAILHPNQDNILPTTDGLDNVRTLITLTAGSHELGISATGEQAGNPVQLRLAWVTPEQRKADYEAAISAARGAAGRCVCMGS